MPKILSKFITLVQILLQAYIYYRNKQNNTKLTNLKIQRDQIKKVLNDKLTKLHRKSLSPKNIFLTESFDDDISLSSENEIIPVMNKNCDEGFEEYCLETFPIPFYLRKTLQDKTDFFSKPFLKSLSSRAAVTAEGHAQHGQGQSYNAQDQTITIQKLTYQNIIGELIGLNDESMDVLFNSHYHERNSTHLIKNTFYDRSMLAEMEMEDSMRHKHMIDFEEEEHRIFYENKTTEGTSSNNNMSPSGHGQNSLHVSKTTPPTHHIKLLREKPDLSTPTKAIIFASWRSGYNFIGQLLEKHPDIFYLFDPFIVTNRMEPKRASRVINKIISNFFKECKLPRYSDYFDEYRNEMLLKQNVDCNQDNLCFRNKGDKFKQPPICEADLTAYSLSAETIKESCPLDEQKILELERICKSDQARIIKSFELADLKSIIPRHLQKDPFFSILLFVRDPRALAISKRSQLGHDAYPLKEIKEDCKNWDQYLNLMRKKSWNCRMHVVRYEDFTNDIEYQSREFLNHFGQVIPEGSDLNEFIWAEANEGFGFDTSKKEPFLDIGETLKEYTTIRHSAAQAYRWIEHATYQDVSEVQETCEKVMKLLGYRILTDEDQFNDTKDVLSGLINNGELLEDTDCEQVTSERLYSKSWRDEQSHGGIEEGLTQGKMWGWDVE